MSIILLKLDSYLVMKFFNEYKLRVEIPKNKINKLRVEIGK